ADLPRERILDALARMEEPAEEPPLRRAEAVAREKDPAARVDAELGDANEEPLVGRGHEPALPADRERVEDQREEAHDHRRMRLSGGRAHPPRAPRISGRDDARRLRHARAVAVAFTNVAAVGRADRDAVAVTVAGTGGSAGLERPG